MLNGFPLHACAKHMTVAFHRVTVGRGQHGDIMCVQTGGHGSFGRHAGQHVQERRTHLPLSPWRPEMFQARQPHRYLAPPLPLLDPNQPQGYQYNHHMPGYEQQTPRGISLIAPIMSTASSSATANQPGDSHSLVGTRQLLQATFSVPHLVEGRVGSAVE